MFHFEGKQITFKILIKNKPISMFLAFNSNAFDASLLYYIEQNLILKV